MTVGWIGCLPRPITSSPVSNPSGQWTTETSGGLQGTKTVFVTDGIGTHASPAIDCLAILNNGDAHGDGLYWLTPPGKSTAPRLCDMTTDGGGWTVFYSNKNGHLNNFDNFANTDYDCPIIGEKCIERMPTGITPEVLAGCGDATVAFTPSSRAYAFFNNGDAISWASLDNPRALSLNVHGQLPDSLYTDPYNGFIICANTSPPSFMGYYRPDPTWDGCNGIAPDNQSSTRLAYRALN